MTKHCQYLRIIPIIFLSLLFSCNTEPDKINIVVFLCDDLGYGDLGSYGHPVIQTPNIDGLASGGIKLTSFYSAAPVCSPSRVGLLTGRSPNRAGVYDFIKSGRRKSEDNRDMVHLQDHEETIPAMLKSVGYSSCLVGKWHCSSLFNSSEQPQPDYFGFDHWFATHNNAAPSHANPRNFVRNGEDVGDIEGYSCQIIVDEAIEWLKGKGEEEPFYLQVCFHEPHEPVASPGPLVEKYLASTDNEDQANYFANVENVDIAVGRLLKYLEGNVEGKTLVIFTSDNGPETLNRYERARRSYGSPGDLKGMKLWTHEAGFRVPCIIKWIGNPGYTGTSDEVVSALDFLPTFCELAGAALPGKEMDGTSLTQLLKGREFTRTKPLLWSFYNALNDHVLAMREGDWKIMARLKNDSVYLPKIENVYDGNEALVKEAELSDYVLYNLKEDRGEAEDVAAEYPELFENMKKQLAEEYENLLADSHIWKRETPRTTVSIQGDKFLINGVPTYEGRSWQGYPIEGLLMNSRMVQGIFDDLNPETAGRWKYEDTGKWDADRNTNEFVEAMDSWHAKGLLAFTINMQGGSPLGYGNKGWINSAYDRNGELHPEYMARLKRILNRADEIGMVPILGLFYNDQEDLLENEAAVLNGVDNVIDWLFEHDYRNVIIEINNECNLKYLHAILQPERVHEVIERIKAKDRNGFRYLAGTSYSGGLIPGANVLQAADFILIHGNGVHDPARIPKMVKQTKALEGYRPVPILFNEDDHFDFDSPSNNFVEAVKAYASWGYFDYRMKEEGNENGFQSVPVNWGISSPRKEAFFNKLEEITGGLK